MRLNKIILCWDLWKRENPAGSLGEGSSMRGYRPVRLQCQEKGFSGACVQELLGSGVVRVLKAPSGEMALQ